MDQHSNTTDDTQKSLRDWRSESLDRLLPIICALIFPGAVMVIIETFTKQSIPLLGVILLMVLYSALVYITINRKLGAQRRTWVLVLLVYLTALVALARGGLAGDGRTYLITLSVLTTLFINIRTGIWVSVVSIVTFMIFGFLAHFGLLNDWLVYHDNPLNLWDWVLNEITLVTMVGIMVFISARSAAFQLQSLHRAEQAARELAETNRRLEEANLNLETAVVERTAELHAANHRLSQLAMHDALTGLPNRTLLYDRLRQSIIDSQAKGLKFALVFIDLDDFKAVNDTYGHEIGDQLLRAVASILQHSVRESDTVARLGGDEYVLIVNDLLDTQIIQRIAAALLETFSRPVALAAVSVSISASLGISLFPEHGTDPETLIHNADQAMYASKTSGKNCYQIFEPGLLPH